jgi:[ribosomal protein S5]-alanine N-acetyltransferase
MNSSTPLPELQTPHLRLRALTSVDVWELWRLWKEPEIRTPPGSEDALQPRQMVEALEACTVLGARVWNVRLRRTDSPVGWAALRPVPWAGPAAVDLAVALLPAAWDHGFAQEASISVLGHGFTTEAKTHACATWLEADPRGAKLLERLGFRLRRWRGALQPPRTLQVMTAADFERMTCAIPRRVVSSTQVPDLAS